MTNTLLTDDVFAALYSGQVMAMFGLGMMEIMIIGLVGILLLIVVVVLLASQSKPTRRD